MSVLDEILDGVRADLAERQARVPIDILKGIAANRLDAIDPIPALEAEGVAVIAEVNLSSPRRGVIADPAGLAADYVAGGAAAISVLTERRRFGGNLDDLRAVRAAVDVPLIRKDFILTGYQLWEARAYGADIALLQVVALEQNALVSLIERAESIGLSTIVECHTAEEVGRAVRAGARIISVNARNLRTLEVDPTAFTTLAPLIPDRIIKIAESGVREPRDVIEHARAGADAVFVGESLLTGKRPRATVADLVAAGRQDRTLALYLESRYGAKGTTTLATATGSGSTTPDPSGRPKTSSRQRPEDASTPVTEGAVVPITIYLSDESAHEEAESTLEDALESSGLEIRQRDDPIIGSWSRKMSAWLRKGANSPKGQRNPIDCRPCRRSPTRQSPRRRNYRQTTSEPWPGPRVAQGHERGDHSGGSLADCQGGSNR